MIKANAVIKEMKIFCFIFFSSLFIIDYPIDADLGIIVPLPAFIQAERMPPGQAGLLDAVLYADNIVFHPAQFPGALHGIKEGKGCPFCDHEEGEEGGNSMCAPCHAAAHQEDKA